MRTQARIHVWAGLLAACFVGGNALAQAADEKFFKYVDDDGRTVYTNVEEQVPLGQRESGRLDLGKVSLNTEIGRELDRRYEEEHRELVATPYCEKAREAARTGLLEEVWTRYSPLVVCGGLVLLLLLLSPGALRRFGAPVWAKVLMMAIPTLVVTGGLAFGLMSANERVTVLRARAEPCQSETYASLSRRPDPIAAHRDLVERLKREIEAAQPAQSARGPR